MKYLITFVTFFQLGITNFSKMVRKICSKAVLLHTTEENIRFGCSSKYLKIRAKEEWILFQTKIPVFLFYIFTGCYFFPLLMRNVGFYLHHTMQDYIHTNGTLKQKSLSDLGHQVKPNASFTHY